MSDEYAGTLDLRGPLDRERVAQILEAIGHGIPAKQIISASMDSGGLTLEIAVATLDGKWIIHENPGEPLTTFVTIPHHIDGAKP